MEKEEISDKISKMMQQLSDIPIMKNRIYKSKDGRYIINELSIKTIKPTNYYDAIIKNTQTPYDKKQEGDSNDRSY
jgi:hypothetical protein